MLPLAYSWCKARASRRCLHSFRMGGLGQRKQLTSCLSPLPESHRCCSAPDSCLELRQQTVNGQVMLHFVYCMTLWWIGSTVRCTQSCSACKSTPQDFLVPLRPQPSMDLCSACRECICNERGQLVQVGWPLACAWPAQRPAIAEQPQLSSCAHHHIKLLLRTVLKDIFTALRTATSCADSLGGLPPQLPLPGRHVWRLPAPAVPAPAQQPRSDGET